MLYLCSKDVKEMLLQILEKFNLPICVDVDVEKVTDLISHDKKASGNKINVVYVNNIGSFEFKTLSILEIKAIIGGNIYE